MTHTAHPAIPPLAGLLACASLAACGGSGVASNGSAARGPVPGGQVITQEEIHRTGARDAFEALERARTHLVIESRGDRIRISHRGAGSFVLGRAILLVVDGNRINDPGAVLRGIPAASIDFIQVLAGHEASVRWGSEAGNGVVLIRTSAR